MKNSTTSSVWSHGGHSARVEMRLIIDAQSLSVAQMGPDYIILNDLIDYPPGTAMLYLKIDNSERSWRVHLPAGLSTKEKRVSIAPVD